MSALVAAVEADAVTYGVVALLGAGTTLLVELGRLTRETRLRRRGEKRTRVDDESDG